jgi:hypothetical protein
MEKTTMTADQASARLAALRHDAGFRERIFAGDADAKGEWSTLIRIAAGTPAPHVPGNSQSIAQTRLDALTSDPEAERQFKELAHVLAGPEDE